MSSDKYDPILIDCESWHYKLFNFGHNLWCSFWDKDEWDCEYYKNRNQNLCKYLRTILIKLPLILIPILVTYAMLIYTFLVFPMKYLASDYIYFWTVAICFSLAVIGFIFLMMFIVSKINDWLEDKHLKKVSLELQEKHKETPPSFWEICVTFLQDRHDRFCRFIKFTNKE